MCRLQAVLVWAPALLNSPMFGLIEATAAQTTSCHSLAHCNTSQLMKFLWFSYHIQDATPSSDSDQGAGQREVGLVGGEHVVTCATTLESYYKLLRINYGEVCNYSEATVPWLGCLP